MMYTYKEKNVTVDTLEGLEYYVSELPPKMGLIITKDFCLLETELLDDWTHSP